MASELALVSPSLHLVIPNLPEYIIAMSALGTIPVIQKFSFREVNT